MDIRPIDVQLTINQAANMTKVENRDQAFTQDTLMHMNQYQEKVEENSTKTASFDDANERQIGKKNEERRNKQNQERKRKAREEARKKKKREYAKMSMLDISI